MTLFTGSCTAMITPFTEDGIDFEAYGRLIDFQIENGTDALLIAGTTGEPPTMTAQEKSDLIRFALDRINKRVPAIVSGLMVLPVLWGNVCKGISQTDGQLLEAARAYRFGRWKTLRLVYVPSVLPYFASGCATGLGLAWKAGVAAEVLCQPRLAIGTQVYRAKITLETPDLFAWTAVVIALSFLLEYALGLLFRRLGKGAKL